MMTDKLKWGARLLITMLTACVLSMLIAASATLTAQDISKTPNSQVVFSSNRDGDFDIYLMDMDNLKVFGQLTDNRAFDLSPSWSPDGNRVAFASNVDGDYDIYVIDVSTGNSVNLTNNAWDDLYSSWSPDGEKIAFTSNRNSNWDVYVMGVNGENPVRLTKNDVYEGNPAWSPEGDKIIYVRGRESERDILVMNTDGTNPQPLTIRTTSADYSPAWSPNGKQIAFVSNRAGNPDIFVVDAACIGNSDKCDQLAHNLTEPYQTTGDLDPTWSPDGKQIIFVSGRDGNTELYLMDADGANIVRLTDEPSDDRFPAWWQLNS